jgi:hypothetical protein
MKTLLQMTGLEIDLIFQKLGLMLNFQPNHCPLQPARQFFFKRKALKRGFSKSTTTDQPQSKHPERKIWFR